MVRFLHTADWQLGMTRWFLDAKAQANYDTARLDAVRAIGALAEAERCGFVVVCGDVFETNHVARDVVLQAFDAMAEHPEVTFYLLPGNHDPLDPTSVFTSSAFLESQPANVVVLDGAGPIPVAAGVELIAAPWRTKEPGRDLVAESIAGCVADGTTRIVAGHGALASISPDRRDPAQIDDALLVRALDEGRIHYVALGDRHSTTVLADGRIAYSGTPEPTDFDEIAPANVLLVTVADGSVDVEDRKVGRWHMLRLHKYLADDLAVDALGVDLDHLTDKARTVVRLVLQGQVSLSGSARLAALLDHHGGRLASLHRLSDDSELVVVPDTADLDSLALRGFASDAVTELAGRACADPPDAAAMDALNLLYRLHHLMEKAS